MRNDGVESSITTVGDMMNTRHIACNIEAITTIIVAEDIRHIHNMKLSSLFTPNLLGLATQIQGCILLNQTTSWQCTYKHKHMKLFHLQARLLSKKQYGK